MSMSPTSIPSNSTQSTHCSNDNVDNVNITFESICTQISHQVNAFLEDEATTPLLRRVQAQMRITLGVIHKALKQYSLDEISLSYNGGKDCLVLLILFLSAIATSGVGEPKTKQTLSSPIFSKSKISSLFPHRLHSVYVMAPHSFPEVDAFVTTSATAYGLDLVRYSLPLKAALTRYLEDNKVIKAIFVGTRRSDPHGKLLTHFNETDNGWPSFMRVHPIIDWNYSEIWAFILHFRIPYCTLYDQGYTSLGGINDTHPNPALRVDNLETYKPAYELSDDDAERLGRNDYHE